MAQVHRTAVSGASREAAERARLVRLARAQVDSAGVVIITFVTSAYDELCVNFAAHLRRARIRSYLLVTFR